MCITNGKEERKDSLQSYPAMFFSFLLANNCDESGTVEQGCLMTLTNDPATYLFN